MHIKSLISYLFIAIFLTSCTLQTSLNNVAKEEKAEDKTSEITTSVEEKEIEIILPIKEFKERITKKPFGIFITPENSPVQPERFSGFHTGVDVEYDDINSDVPVFAVEDGVVEFSNWVSGYGGVMAIRYLIDGKRYLAIYGHLNPDKLIAKDESVSKGEQISILGKEYSRETDGERKHLHFGLYTGNDVNLKGYVATKDQLSAWVDPEIIFSSY